MDLATIERFAAALLAPPNLVSAESLEEATLFFEDLKKRIAIDECLMLLRESKNSFVLFQIGQAIGEIVLRDWSLIEAANVQLAYKTLLKFVATSLSLESYVVGACLKSAAMIIKRGILDGKSGDQEELYQCIHQMLTSVSSTIQAVGCLFISALIEQFSSESRNSNFTLPSDFHLQAKSTFENNGLRRLHEMSMALLRALSNQDDIVGNNFTRRLCDRFLEVSENILLWNFDSDDKTSTSFRPPITWKDRLENDEFFILFFKLHSTIRHDETLCTKSMNCLIQLASLTGDCMPVSDQVASTKYVRIYISNLLELFVQGPSAWETNHFCMIINRLFLYRPLTSFMRQEQELKTKFFGFLKEYTVNRTNKEMQRAIGEAEHEDHTSLALVYDGIVALLRDRRTCSETEEEADQVDNKLVKSICQEIVTSFISNCLAPPKGHRPIANSKINSEDRTLFANLFNPLSSMICYNVADFMDHMTTNLRISLVEFNNMASDSADMSRLPIWQKKQHWLMLILANSIVGEESDGACHVSGDVFDHTLKLFHSGKKYCAVKKAKYLQLCIESPTQDRQEYANEVDPFIVIMGELFAWAAVEYRMFVNSFMSSKLCRTTFLCLGRFVNASSRPVDCEKLNDYQGVKSENLPILPADESFSATLVRFVIKKVLHVLIKYGSQENLCQDAIDCLWSLVKSQTCDIELSQYYAEPFNVGSVSNRAHLIEVLKWLDSDPIGQGQRKMLKLIYGKPPDVKKLICLDREIIKAEDVIESLKPYLKDTEKISGGASDGIRPVTMEIGESTASSSHQNTEVVKKKEKTKIGLLTGFTNVFKKEKKEGKKLQKTQDQIKYDQDMEKDNTESSSESEDEKIDKLSEEVAQIQKALNVSSESAALKSLEEFKLMKNLNGLLKDSEDRLMKNADDHAKQMEKYMAKCVILTNRIKELEAQIQKGEEKQAKTSSDYLATLRQKLANAQKEIHAQKSIISNREGVYSKLHTQIVEHSKITEKLQLEFEIRSTTRRATGGAPRASVLSTTASAAPRPSSRLSTSSLVPTTSSFVPVSLQSMGSAIDVAVPQRDSMQKSAQPFTLGLEQDSNDDDDY